MDKNLFDKLPLESQSSSLSSLVTLGDTRDRRRFKRTFSRLRRSCRELILRGRPTHHGPAKQGFFEPDSYEFNRVHGGHRRSPPAEFGDKTSVVINVTTRSGQGMTTPHGGMTTSYGSFGTSNVDFNVGFGGKKWGNFIATNGHEYQPLPRSSGVRCMHDKGNEENGFDRVDYQLSKKDSLHLNLGFTRSWFQTPNSYDSQNATAWNGLDGIDSPWIIGGLDPKGDMVGPADQRSQIKTFNIAPSWQHLIGSTAMFTSGALFAEMHTITIRVRESFCGSRAPDLQRRPWDKTEPSAMQACGRIFPM